MTRPTNHLPHHPQPSPTTHTPPLHPKTLTTTTTIPTTQRSIGDRVARIGSVATENAAAWDRDGLFENRLLRGREGTSIRVELLRTEAEPSGGGGSDVRVPVMLRRQSFAARHYPALAVQTLLDSDGRRVAYIRLRRFDAQATAQLRSVLYAEERVGASAYVLDLRNNMGGIFQEALKMAALFLEDPKVRLWVGSLVGGVYMYMYVYHVH